MSKKLNHLQAHRNKKPKKIPPSKFEIELSELAKQVGFKFNQKR